MNLPPYLETFYTYRASTSRQNYFYTIYNHSVCASVYLSACLCRLVNEMKYIWFGFDIDLPFLAHESIIIGGYIAYIRDPDTTLIFEFMVKLIGFFICLLFPVYNFCFCFDISL